ncbi:MAG TPA: type II toxin-antitoxin system VapC family toxin [Candidatus Defluviicoccus seviourii]|nr:type II toxin-antitoxin system VapC family toxin [Candidatus Defluviicoccus seviourii]
MSLVVDASVALKWFLPEPDSQSAEALLAGREVLIAPTLIISEVCNAAWKRWRRGETTARHAEWVAEGIATVGVMLIGDQDLAVSAMAIARRLDHPVYDCFYLALAEQRDAVMVTADKRLIARVSGTEWQGRVVALADYGVAAS